MEGDIDTSADAVDQSYLVGDAYKKRSSGEAVVDLTRYTFSGVIMTDVGPQPDTTALTITPEVEKRILSANLNPTTVFLPASRGNNFVKHSSVAAPNAKVSTTVFQALATNLVYGRQNPSLALNTAGSGHGPLLRPTPSALEQPSIPTTVTASTTPDTFSLELPMTGTGQETLTTEQKTVSSQTGFTSSTPNGSPNASQTKAIAGGATGACVIVILGVIVFCILRRKRQYRAARSASGYDVPTSSGIPGQRTPRSARLPTTPQPFLGFPMMQNHSSSKGIITGHTNVLTRNNQGDIEQAADPFEDPVLVESLTDNDDEVQRVRDTLDRLQALTSRFGREVQQLGVLARSPA